MQVAALVAAGDRLAAAPAPAVFTARQAATGRTAFAANCAPCHMPDLSGNNDAPPLAGTNFVTSWRTRTTKDLLDYMSAAMPPSGASLTSDTYAAITAYILQVNGALAGDAALGATTAVPIGVVAAHDDP